MSRDGPWAKVSVVGQLRESKVVEGAGSRVWRLLWERVHEGQS